MGPNPRIPGDWARALSPIPYCADIIGTIRVIGKLFVGLASSKLMGFVKLRLAVLGKRSDTINMNNDYDPRAYVMVESNYVSIKNVEVTDTAEDIFGRDEVTFMYQGKQYQSLVLIK